MPVNKDFRDLLATFGAREVRFLIVGAYAVTFHARPRFTKDLDIWVEPTPTNAGRVWVALAEFGAPLRAQGVEEKDFASHFDGVPVAYLSREDLITNKVAVGRPKDLADVRELRKV